MFMVGLYLLVKTPESQGDAKSSVVPGKQKQVNEAVKSNQYNVPEREKKKLDLINENLNSTHGAKKIRSGRVDVDNFEVSEMNDKIKLNNTNLDYGVTVSGEDKAGGVYKDLKEDEESFSDISPGDKIQSRLSFKKWEENYDEGYENAYVVEFLEKARASGYKIRLNENLEVISVKKIKRRNSYESPH